MFSEPFTDSVFICESRVEVSSVVELEPLDLFVESLGVVEVEFVSECAGISSLN